MASDDLITSGTPLQSSFTSKELEVKASDTTKKTLKDVQKSLENINKIITSINANLKKTPSSLKNIASSSESLENLIKDFKESDSKSLKVLPHGSYQTQINRAALRYYSSEMLYNNPAFTQAQLTAVRGKIDKANKASYVSQLSGQLMGSALRTRTGAINKNAFVDLNQYTIKEYKSAFKEAEEGLRSMFYTGQIGAERFNKTMKSLSGASEKYLKPIENSLKGSADATSKNTKEMERWARISDGSLALIQTRLIANYTIINSITGAFRYVIGYVIELDKELRNLQAITGVSNSGLKALKSSIVETANATRYTSLEVAKAATILGQAGLSVNQIKETLKPIAELATASGTELVTATEVITSTLNIYELQTAEAARVTNALTTAVNESKADIGGMQYALQYAGKSAADLGMSFEETAAAVAAMTQAGIKSRSTLGTGLRAILVELLNPTAKLRKELESVGLSMEDVDVKSLGFTQVLKNLRDAGFGVAEAYAGMERRGASAMTALLSQVDFIDELRENMNGSNAAVKGNINQMQAFANVIDNTRSIVGSATSDALEPYLKVLTSIFKTINENLGTMSEFGKNLLFGGTVLATLTVTAKAFYGILANVFKLLAGGTLTKTLLGAGGFAGVAKLTIAIGALGLGINKLIDYFYRLENELDKYQGKLEDVDGEINKYKESYNSLSNMMDRALQNRERLFDESGKPTHELDIFMNELISRFPQVNDILSESVNSFEDLVRVINKSRLEMAKLEAQADDTAPKLADAANKVAAAIYGRALSKDFYNDDEYYKTVFGDTPAGPVIMNRFGKDLDRLVSSGIISRQERLGITKNVVSGSKDNITDPELIGDKFGEEVKKVLDERVSKGVDEQVQLLRQISALLANPATSKEMKEFFSQYKEYINILQKEIRGNLSTSVNEAVNKNTTNLTGFKDRIDALAQEYKSLESGDVSLLSVTDYVDRTEVMKETAKKIEEDLKNLPDEIYGSEDWSRYIKQGIKPESIRYEISSSLGGYYQDLISQTRELFSKMTKDSEDLVKKSERELRKTEEGRINTILRNLQNVRASELDSKLTEIKNTYAEEEKLALEKAKQEFEKLPGGEQTYKIREETIKAEYAEKIKAAEDAVDNVKNSITTLSSKTESYFRALQTANEKVSSEYERKIKEIEAHFMYREGLLEGLSDIGQGDSQLSKFIKNKMDFDKREGLLVQKHEAKKALTYYEKQLKKIEGNEEEFRRVSLERKRAEKALDVAKENPEKYSKNQLNELTKNLENAARSEQRYIDVLNETKDKIVELRGTIDKLDGNIESITYLDKKSTLESAGLGVEAGAYNYLKDNNSPYPNVKAGLFELTALTTNTGLTEMENQFASLFRTIQDGSKSAKDTFKDFTTSILQAMADVVYSEIAKSMMKIFLSMFNIDKTAPMGDSINLFDNMSYGSGSGSSNSINIASSIGSTLSSIFTGTPSTGTGYGSWFGFTKGGLVTGPVKNRDSVSAKLMPGEFVINKQATDALGTDFLNNLNNGNAQALGDINSSNGLNGEITSSGKSKDSVVNVWVVTPDQVPSSQGPNDVIAQVTQDIRTNGPIKKLIKQVSTGAI